MLFMIYYFLFAFMFINIMMREIYPEEYKYYMCMKLIYIFSKMQICYNKIHHFVYKSNPFLISFLNTYEKSKHIPVENNLEFILNGKVIKSSNIKKSFHKENCDFAIYSDYITLGEAHYIYNKIIQLPNNSYNSPNNSYNSNYEVCNIRFLLCEVYIDDNTDDAHKIDLISDKYNYYVVHNVINRAFVLYYLQTYLKISAMDHNTTKLTLCFIDHNANKFTINLNNNLNNIRFTKDNYNMSMIFKE